MVGMDEISLAQKFVNLFLLMGGAYVIFYYLIYGTLFPVGTGKTNALRHRQN